MKKIVMITVILILSFVNLPIFGQAKKNTAGDKELAFVFNLNNLLLSVNAYNDGGGEAGSGIKYWLLDNLALRGLLMFDMVSETDPNADPPVTTTTTSFGIGAAVEFHLARGDVSPYIGGLTGVTMIPQPPDNETAVNFYAGAIFGAEAKLWSYLSVYAEYSLLCSFVPNQFEAKLGLGNNGQVGLLFYFK